MRFILLMILTGCTSVFYQPTRILYATPERFEISHEDIFFASEDGTQLHGWYMSKTTAQKKRGFITLFHGNAQNLSSHFYSLAWIVEHGWDVFIFDYRGYGLSVGTPTPEKVNLDAIAALKKSQEFVTTKGYEHWIVHGQSLGGIVSMRALEDYLPENPGIDLLVLDCTFDSYDSVAFDVLKSHWLTFLFSPLGPLFISDAYAPESFFKTYKGKVLVMHGMDDQVIAPKFGKRIFEKLETPHKHWWPIAGAKHIEAFHHQQGKETQKKFLKFLDTGVF